MVRSVTTHYLHALVDGLPRDWSPPAGGPGTVRLSPVADLQLVESLLTDAAARIPVALGRHHAVVATLTDADAVLPFAPDTVIAAGELAPWLAARLPVLRAALRRLRGHVEVTLRLVPLTADVGPRAGEPARRLAERLVEGADGVPWRYRAVARRSAGAELAFLVRRDDVSALLARIAPLVSRAAGVAVVPSGPRPPCAFVPPLDPACNPAVAIDLAG